MSPNLLGSLSDSWICLQNATQKSQKVFVHVPSEIATHDVQKLLFCCLILLLSSVLFLTVTARSSIFKAAKGKGAPIKVPKEALKPVDDRKVGKRKAVTKADKDGKSQAKKGKLAKKDPNKPKRPPSAFFVFLYEFLLKTLERAMQHTSAVSSSSVSCNDTDKVLYKPNTNTIAENANGESRRLFCCKRYM
ncbi:High mobility group B protein 1 [Camellia lanceoleosa]|uniref:High mobility group B protein 1 n=1 Tax=Camellia lanceoleosa TaxID=1840588 RepID=A0ACC0GP83_9ERIC|nr:High mobility group B protein 1 [Camellia lanceoleosa]